MPSVGAKMVLKNGFLVDPLWIPDDEEPPKKTSRLQRYLIGDMPQRAHVMKLLTLGVLALVHFFYLNSFIENFRAYEDLSMKVESSSMATEKSDEAHTVHFIMRNLIAYKKNLWVTVGAMCASLATTSFLLLVAETVRMNIVVKIMLRVVDLLAFLALPFLLVSRHLLAKNLITYMQAALRASMRITSTNEFLNTLGCSIIPRENLPPCSRVMIKSIFPVKVLEYLIILCVLTGAYIALAYLIEYCIRHWFPPNKQRKNDNQRQPLVLQA